MEEQQNLEMQPTPISSILKTKYNCIHKTTIPDSKKFLVMPYPLIQPIIFFFLNDPATPETSPLPQHDALPIPMKASPTGHPADARGGSTSATSNGSVIAQAGVDIFTARYSAKAAWSGWINAETVQADRSITAAAGWQGKSTADHLDALSDQQVLNERLILTWSDRLQRRSEEHT